MPEEHQVRLIHSIVGLEKAQIVKPGWSLMSYCYCQHLPQLSHWYLVNLLEKKERKKERND